jgi:hypothetical protein
MNQIAVAMKRLMPSEAMRPHAPGHICLDAQRRLAGRSSSNCGRHKSHDAQDTVATARARPKLA